MVIKWFICMFIVKNCFSIVSYISFMNSFLNVFIGCFIENRCCDVNI